MPCLYRHSTERYGDLHVRHAKSAGTVSVGLRTGCLSCPIWIWNAAKIDQWNAPIATLRMGVKQNEVRTITNKRRCICGKSKVGSESKDLIHAQYRRNVTSREVRSGLCFFVQIPLFSTCEAVLLLAFSTDSGLGTEPSAFSGTFSETFTAP